MNNIIKLINYYKNNLDIISFQEMSFIDNNSFNYFYKSIKDKFPYYYNCSNGNDTDYNYDYNVNNNQYINDINDINDSEYKNTQNNILSIFVFTNKKYKFEIIKLQLTFKEMNYINKKYNLKYRSKTIQYRNKTIRNIILLYTEYGKIAFVHLEIGLRCVYDNKLNMLIKKLNSEVRIIMLKKILLHNPDILIGDMNFTLNDLETKFLNKNKYYQQNTDEQNSTPYNRVDHCFIKKRINNKDDKIKNKIMNNNTLLKCNYSDHLPMFQNLEPIITL